MPDGFNDKDYSSYFEALEKSVKKEQERNSQPPKKRLVENRQSKRKIKIRPSFLAVVSLLLVIVILLLCVRSCSKKDTKKTAEPIMPGAQQSEETQEKTSSFAAQFDESTLAIPSEFQSESIIVVDCEENRVAAAREATARCYPASTTKIMTLLVAVENTKNFDDTFTMSYEITDPLYVTNTTVAGFQNGEEVTITDLLYGAILPSGADACAGLGIKIAGSEEKFVELMNKKAEELRLKDTHFTNASGVFDEQHYTTAADMAVIIRAAMENELCRKVLSTYQYTTRKTAQSPQGIELTSTLFSYMYGDEPDGSNIMGGKTGFVNESGYCIATFGETDSGKEYVCVTLGGNGVWPTVKDQINLYTAYAK